jgi:hypothetical protein
LVAVTFAA